MSLNAREKRVLDAIEGELACSDPALYWLLATFGGPSNTRQRRILRSQLAWPLAWLAVSIALIVVGALISGQS